MGASKVTASKPKIAGGIYAAPIGTALPKDAASPLSDAFKNLGYVSNEGITNSNGASSTDINSWGGAVVLTVPGVKSDSFKLKLLETLNEDVLKTVHGEDNVEGTLDAGLTIKVNNTAVGAKVWVIDMILRDGILKRIVIPDGTISEVGDVVYKDDDAVCYDITIKAVPDSDGNTHYEYIKKGAA